MLEFIRRFILVIVGIAGGMITSIITMIYGWGLSPKNWWFIIGFYLIGTFISMFILKIAGEA